MSLQAGRLDKRIVIQSLVESRDAVGQPIATWSTHATVWAACDPMRGREFFSGAGIHAASPMLFRIRYLASVAPTMRVIYKGGTFEIDSVLDYQEQRTEMHLYCVALDVPAPEIETNYLLLESGDAILLESGDNLLTEA